MPRHEFRETAARYASSARALKTVKNLPRDRQVRVTAGLIQDLLDRAEAAEDIRAYDTAKAAPGALIPADVMSQIWNGENCVRVLRAWRRMSQGALADAAGLSQAYVCEIEKGKNLSARAAKALARALDIDISDLLTLS